MSIEDLDEEIRCIRKRIVLANKKMEELFPSLRELEKLNEEFLARTISVEQYQERLAQFHKKIFDWEHEESWYPLLLCNQCLAAVQTFKQGVPFPRDEMLRPLPNQKTVYDDKFLQVMSQLRKEIKACKEGDKAHAEELAEKLRDLLERATAEMQRRTGEHQKILLDGATGSKQ